MTIKFTDLAKGTKTATLELPDEQSIIVEYRYRLLTPRLLHDLMALNHMADLTAADPDQLEEIGVTTLAVSQQLAKLIAKWNVVEEDGVTMFPLNAERIAADIPFPIQAELIALCMGGVMPGEVTSATSDAIS